VNDKKPRLVWVEGTEARPGLGRLWAFLDGYLKSQAEGMFDVSFVAFPRPAGGVRQASPRLASEIMGLAASDAAARHGADLIIYNDWAMPIYATRAHLDVPVTGVAEASALIGNTLALRPAIVTVAEGLRWGFERDVREFGFADRMLHPSVWWLDPQSTHEDVQDAIDRPEKLVDRFDKVAHEAVMAGADAILVGCGYLGPILGHAGYRHVVGRPDIPVYDCTHLAYELGVMLYRLHQAGVSPSRRGHQLPGAESRTALTAVLEHVRLSGTVEKPTITTTLGE
jgi:Asp/Glu/hydantoin racemase